MTSSTPNDSLSFSNLPNPIIQLLAQAQSMSQNDGNLQASLQQLLQMQNNNNQTTDKKKRKEQDPNKPTKKKTKIDADEDQADIIDKRRAPKACVHCQKSHLSCEAARPCKRCIDRKIAHLCFDPPSKPKGRKRKDVQFSFDSQAEASSVNQNYITTSSPIISNSSPFAPVAPETQTLQRILQSQKLLASSSTPTLPSAVSSSAITLPIPNSPMQPTFSNSLGLSNLFSPPTPSNFLPPTPTNVVSSPSITESSPMSEESLSLSKVLFAPVDKLDLLLGTLNPASPSYLLPQTPNETYAESNNENVQNSVSKPFFPHDYTLDFFTKVLAYFENRAPEIVDDIKTLISLLKPNILKSVQNLNKEQVQDIQKTFEEELQFARSAYARINVPTVVWEKSNQIHYCNPSFRSLTGFSGEVPTSPYDFALYEMISTSSLKRFFQVFTNALTDGVTSFVVLPLEWLCYGKFLNVIGSFTLKRDLTGFPVLITGHLLPVVFSPVLDIQLSTISRRPFEGSLFFPGVGSNEEKLNFSKT